MQQVIVIKDVRQKLPDCFVLCVFFKSHFLCCVFMSVCLSPTVSVFVGIFNLI